MGNKRGLEGNIRCVDDDGRLGNKKGRLVLVDEDYFDRLPEEIVVRIVDRLSWKDAAKSCLLSHRFHHVSKTSILHRKSMDFEDFSGEPCLKFVEFVNRMLQMHEGSKVDSLRIAFTAQFRDESDAESKLNDGFKSWLTFARDKSVHSLNLDFLRSSMYFFSCRFYPKFPMFDGWEKLTSLSLRMVSVDGAELERGLKSHLVNLESLSVQYAPLLKWVVVASPKLKTLEIKHCFSIRSITIDLAPNLQCFIYHDGYYDVPFKVVHAPKLSYVSLGPGDVISQDFWSELQKVETLEKLELIDLGSPYKEAIPFSTFKSWDRLTSLWLKSVKVLDEYLTHLMDNNLETLHIEDASHLETVLVKSTKLKRLEIVCCSLIHAIDVDFAPNLEYFRYQAPPNRGDHKIVVTVNVAPKLSHIYYQGETRPIRLL